MTFLIDEDVAIEVPRCLRNEGHQVLLVIEVLGPETADSEIWQYAIEKRAILISCNRQDFLTLAGTDPATGLIILNRKRSRQSECRNVLRLIGGAGEAGLRRNINFA